MICIVTVNNSKVFDEKKKYHAVTFSTRCIISGLLCMKTLVYKKKKNIKTVRQNKV